MTGGFWARHLDPKRLAPRSGRSTTSSHWTPSVQGRGRDNAAESLNRVLTKTLKTEFSIPTEEAATKLTYRAIRNYAKGGRTIREWVAARNQLAIVFNGRFDA